MNKIDLIQALKDSNDLSKSEAETVVNLFFDKMAEALAQGDRVEIRGLCSFFVKRYGGYTGRNPKTGEKVKVARKKLPFFKVGKELKNRWMGEVRKDMILLNWHRRMMVSVILRWWGYSQYICPSTGNY
jgi:integration host factor subunit beta